MDLALAHGAQQVIFVPRLNNRGTADRRMAAVPPDRTAP
jgi:hypothetical protein